MAPKATVLTEYEAEYKCPHCGSKDKCLNGYPRYRCRNCKRNFLMSETSHRRGLPNIRKIRCLSEYLTQNPIEDLPANGKIRRKCVIVHENYMEITRRNIRKMASDCEVSPTTFYKIITDFKVRLNKLDFDILPTELRFAIKSKLKTKKITVDSLRSNLPQSQINALLTFLYSE